MSRSLFLIWMFFNFCCLSAFNQESSTIFPENPEQRVVYDASKIFDDDQKKELTLKLIDYEVATTNEIVVVTLDSITPYTDIQHYASDLANYWGVGKQGKDNGLIILFSKPLRRVAIATGFGTEHILTDSICSQVINIAMIPYFKEDQYYEGISNGIDSLIDKWEN